MSSDTDEKHKPEDMLLRVIRVAEILVKSQEDVPIKTPYPEPSHDKPQATSYQTVAKNTNPTF